MLSTRIIGAAVLAVTATACGDSSGGSSITAPVPGPSIASHSERIPNGKASGHLEVNNFGYFDTYTFEAVNKSGEVTGTLAWTSIRPSREVVRGDGRVLCLTVIDNVAHLGAELQPDDLLWAPPPFNHVIWTVVDNERGPNKAPDLASLVIAFKTREQVEAHCRAGNLAIAPLDRGDVKVRGGLHVSGFGMAENE